MKCRVLLFAMAILFVLAPVIGYGLNARVETIDGGTFDIRDFSMDGRHRFSVDHKGTPTTIDWSDIVSFELKQVNADFWVEVRTVDGKKEAFRMRQMSSFRGRADFGPWSMPFQKVKSVLFMGETVHETQKQETPVKEADLIQFVDKVLMRNGDIILGNILTEVFSVRTTYGTFPFKKADIRRLTFGAPGKKEKEVDTLYSRYGDKLTGSISESQIRITLFTKAGISIPRDHIKEVEFGVTPELEQTSSP